MKECHKILIALEAQKLEKKGYHIEFEKKLGKDGYCKVDLIAKRGNEIIVVECGYLDTIIRDEIKEKVGKFLWVPYIRLWCHKHYPRPPEKLFIPVDVMKMGETLGKKSELKR